MKSEQQKSKPSGYTDTFVSTEEHKKLFKALAKTDRFCLKSKGEIIRFLINQGAASQAVQDLLKG